MHRPTGKSLHGATVCSFTSILNNNRFQGDVKKPLLTSGQIQRYILFPTVIPTCHRQQRWWGTIPGLFHVGQVLLVQRSAYRDTAELSFKGLPRIRRLRIGRPRMLAAMFPWTTQHRKPHGFSREKGGATGLWISCCILLRSQSGLRTWSRLKALTTFFKNHVVTYLFAPTCKFRKYIFI